MECEDFMFYLCHMIPNLISLRFRLLVEVKKEIHNILWEIIMKFYKKIKN